MPLGLRTHGRFGQALQICNDFIACPGLERLFKGWWRIFDGVVSAIPVGFLTAFSAFTVGFLTTVSAFAVGFFPTVSNFAVLRPCFVPASPVFCGSFALTGFFTAAEAVVDAPGDEEGDLTGAGSVGVGFRFRTLHYALGLWGVFQFRPLDPEQAPGCSVFHSPPDSQQRLLGIHRICSLAYVFRCA